jgi:phosphotransferase system HPr (HPr) family protein
MSGEVLRRTVTIANPQGFHLRPQQAFVALARKFASTITVCRDDLRVDGKSPFELMLVSSTPVGGQLVIEARGADAAAALDALAPVVESPTGPDEEE